MNETTKYTGKSTGFHATVTATLEIDNNKISEIDADYQPNTVGGLAIERMKDMILAKNSVEVDAISGATFSSSAFRAAARKAYHVYTGALSPEKATDPEVSSSLDQEGADIQTSASKQVDTSKPQNTSPVQKPVYLTPDTKFAAEYDVIIIGGGGAGLAAAAQATSDGLSVLLCEKSGIVGGSTSYSGGVLQASNTKYQKELSHYQNDDPAKHAQYWLAAGEGSVDERLVTDLAYGAPQNIEWLANLGIKWTSMYGNCHIPYIDDQLFADRIHVYQGGGMSGNGAVLVKALLQAATKNQTTFWYNSPAVALIKDQHNEQIAGVIVDRKGTPTKVKAKRGVVLATASIDHNPALAFKLNRQHYDDLMHKTCLSAQTNTGDGIIMGMSVSGAITGMGGCIDFDGKTGNGTDNRVPTIPLIFVNAAGKRFVCEDATYAYQYRAIFEQEKQFNAPTYMIFGQNSLDYAGSPWTEGSISKDVKNGEVAVAETLTDLSEMINIPHKALRASVDNWNQAMENGADPEFSRQTGLAKIHGPYYAYKNTATNLGAIGGLKINTDSQVLDNFDQPITGLYAAGLNAGGWLGPYYPGSGTAVSGIIHQGRKAAMHLAKI